MAIVEFRDLWKTYRMGDNDVHALRGINLSFPEGEYVAIMGPSGSGKSTLLNMLGCLDRPTSGTYMLGDADVGALDDNTLSVIRSRRIGFIFQSYNLIPQLTVVENIEVPLYYQGWSEHESRDRAAEMAELVGLVDRLGHRPTELSGGQQQRVAIARALASDPLILLGDEPTGNLDSVTGAEIMDILGSLHDQGKTIIMVTHEEEIAQHAERIIHLADGKVAEERNGGRYGKRGNA
jgi:putative ABC transport system ATP-binding protein